MKKAKLICPACGKDEFPSAHIFGKPIGGLCGRELCTMVYKLWRALKGRKPGLKLFYEANTSHGYYVPPTPKKAS